MVFEKTNNIQRPSAEINQTSTMALERLQPIQAKMKSGPTNQMGVAAIISHPSQRIGQGKLFANGVMFRLNHGSPIGV